MPEATQLESTAETASEGRISQGVATTRMAVRLVASTQAVASPMPAMAVGAIRTVPPPSAVAGPPAGQVGVGRRVALGVPELQFPEIVGATFRRPRAKPL